MFYLKTSHIYLIYESLYLSCLLLRKIQNDREELHYKVTQKLLEEPGKKESEIHICCSKVKRFLLRWTRGPATHISPKDNSSHRRPCQRWAGVVIVIMCDLSWY